MIAICILNFSNIHKRSCVCVKKNVVNHSRRRYTRVVIGIKALRK